MRQNRRGMPVKEKYRDEEYTEEEYEEEYEEDYEDDLSEEDYSEDDSSEDYDDDYSDSDDDEEEEEYDEDDEYDEEDDDEYYSDDDEDEYEEDDEDDDDEYYSDEDDDDDEYDEEDEDDDDEYDSDDDEYLIPPRAVKKPAPKKAPGHAPKKASKPAPKKAPKHEAKKVSKPAPKKTPKHEPKHVSKPAPKKAPKPEAKKASKPVLKQAPKQEPQEEKKKKSAFGRFVRTLFVIAFILLGGLYAFVWYVYGGVKYEEISSVKNEAFSEDGVTNILLIGNDSRKNGTDGRSDAMILLSISNRTHRILFTSLLRDMYVDIPGHGKNRLNSAYSYGGPELLMETVEENFGIRVNRYVSVNFEAFAGMVDAVGGVDMNVTSDEVFLIDAYLNEYNMLLGREITTDYLDPTLSGWVKLNGAQALAYTRNRYIGTDFGRTERQRKVIDAVIKAFPGALLHRGPVIFKEMASYMTTNLTMNECYLLALQGWTPFVYGRDMGSLPLEGTWNDYNANGMAVLKVDFDANRKYLDEMLFTGAKEDDNG